jgi:alpha-N-arabinofuranosidase
MKRLYVLVVVFVVSSLVQTEAQKTYNNPILAGFYPDPSICRVGNDYYIVNSSFAYFPGLPLFHSTDLVNWKQIGHAMDRKEQLDLTNAGVSRGLFAPALTYHKGTYYIVCTLIDKGGNFVITAQDPKGPWSNPAWIPDVDGIDPSIFFDDNDKAYIVYNSIPPNNKSMHQGHRTIRIVEFDAAALKVTSENTIIVNGGTDMAKKPVWIEGPHLLKKDGWYYLICAEGGTEYNHSEVVFRSKDVMGPYISYEKNPILTQRHLDKQRKNPVTSTGHADFVETPDGKWYAVFLGCRPYRDDLYNTGRETFMAPVTWKDGWPVILEGNETVKFQYPVPMPAQTKLVENKFNGNVNFRDDFNGGALNNRYAFLRNPVTGLYSTTSRKGYLILSLDPATASGKESPVFVGFRQPNQYGYAATQLEFNPASEKERAGLMVFQNETHYYFLCKSMAQGKPAVQLFKSAKVNEQPELIASETLTGGPWVQLKIEAKGDHYDFYYAEKNGNWNLLEANVDGTFLSTKVAGGFVGCMYALHASSTGTAVYSNGAAYDWFEYKGDDPVYRKSK